MILEVLPEKTKVQDHKLPYTQHQLTVTRNHIQILYHVQIRTHQTPTRNKQSIENLPHS